jgi:mannose-6-phosphate isomerase
MSNAPGTRRLRDWLCHQALPLWASAGRDPAGGFVERFARDGKPDLDAPRRVMVQARQIYVYAHAAMMRLMPDGVAIAQSGVDFLLRHGAPDGLASGFVHQLDRQGRVLDDTRDLYDHAFLLTGFSWYYRASADPRAKEVTEGLIGVIAGLRHQSGLGYRENSKNTPPRRQNPHMHLLEAFLAAHQATGRQDMLEKAGEIVDLFHDHFFRAGILNEFFEEDLTPALTPAGGIAEPGHHHEWIWLLSRFSRATGREMAGAMRALYNFAARHGVEPVSGLLYNEIWADGRIKDAAKRLWPQTEQFKAQCVLGLPGAPATLDRIFRHFLEPALVGTWVDRLNVHNVPLKGTVPASSFYHLFLAFAESDQAP